ncbi:MAG: hypothetical protein ACOYOK_00785 [Pseudobdellovibrionaceae bacterium]
MISKISFLLVALVSSISYGYFRGSYQTSLDPLKRTRVLIVGHGSELGTQFQVVAAAKAKKYRELYPQDQILLISVDEYADRDKEKITQTNMEYLGTLGFTDIQEPESGLKTHYVLDELQTFKKIASIDIFSHSTAYYGVILDGPFNRMDPKRDGYEKLQPNFTSDAYAFLHGCNSGQILAPIFSKIWGIPVAGSLTFSSFYRLASDGQFYANYGKNLPAGVSWAQKNNFSYDQAYNCNSGACLILKPDNIPYTGYWGEFSQGGLGFYKFYCLNNSQDHCFKTMAQAALSFLYSKSLRPASSFQDFKNLIIDFLCPISGSKPQVRKECNDALEAVAAGLRTSYDSFDGKSLQCNFKYCEAKFSCQRVPLIDLLKPGSCKVTNLRTSNKTTTQSEEFKAYLKGWELLQQEAN